MTERDPHGLRRFVDAQDGVYETALGELAAGRKRSHWMWFVFPQVAGLGHSAMAQRYAISSLTEARAYLAHPELGDRLRACTRAVLGLGPTTLGAVFGAPDDMKFVSSMTLFSLADDEADSCFAAALKRFRDGAPDRQTLALLGERTTL